MSTPARAETALWPRATREEDTTKLIAETFQDRDLFETVELREGVVGMQDRPDVVSVVEQSHAVVVTQVENLQNLVPRDPRRLKVYVPALVLGVGIQIGLEILQMIRQRLGAAAGEARLVVEDPRHLRRSLLGQPESRETAPRDLVGQRKGLEVAPVAFGQQLKTQDGGPGLGLFVVPRDQIAHVGVHGRTVSDDVGWCGRPSDEVYDIVDYRFHEPGSCRGPTAACWWLDVFGRFLDAHSA